MHDRAIAIGLSAVTKRYVLYPSRKDLLLAVCGLDWLRFWRKSDYPDVEVLKGISLQIPRGARIGIIGRNGAGKTTLLKLITGNFAPTTGAVHVNGSVQALMTTGLGFHPDLTGAQNIRASLVYNGLTVNQMEEAFADIVEFVELGEYLDQPMKTYSLGMQSRLAFATATAVRPDILIVDEVLGAGDAYFAAKSSERMRNLTGSGATLILVSHSMQQIIQFCDRTIWIERGQVVKDGDSLEVVKAYEQYIRRLDDERMKRANAERVAARLGTEASAESNAAARHHEDAIGVGTGTDTRAGVFRWPGDGNLTIQGFRTLDGHGAATTVFESGGTLTYEVAVENSTGNAAPCTVAINTYLLDGKQVLLDWSQSVAIPAGRSVAQLIYSPLILGNGEYVVTIGLYRLLDMNNLSTASYYDLWDRSFQFKVYTSYPLDGSIVKAPCAWHVTGDTKVIDCRV